MAIKIEGLIKTFDEKIVLNGLDLIIEEGRTTCIMGPSGCGKTTLLMILMGLLPYDSGSIAGLEEKRMSAVFQEDRLCENFSPVSNVRLVCPPHVSKSDISIGLSAIGLGDSLSQPVRELSGGMRRRVAILRALMAEYDVLFMDEPLKGLDDKTKESVIRFVKQETKGKTVIMITHDETEAESFDAEKVILEKRAGSEDE